MDTPGLYHTPDPVFAASAIGSSYQAASGLLFMLHLQYDTSFVWIYRDGVVLGEEHFFHSSCVVSSLSKLGRTSADGCTRVGHICADENFYRQRPVSNI